ncbi:MAG: T9SS type A sorting domain-containing protein, partial [Bacteroidales bacterium]|nr:T9SS type A sorting domain-containing protein [Bacteroidales bacterium]
ERGVSEGSLKINVANKNYNDVAYVLFKEGLGLSKIAHFNTEIPMVSVSVEGKEYAVATMNKEVTEIPVSFKAMTMGEYTISVEAQDVEETIYLTDKLTGERVNLNTDSYTFMATSNDNTDRFVLTKVLDTTGIEQNAEYSVYVSNDEIRFNNVNGNLNVRIYDMLGRPVAEYNVFESATISTSSFETGMYILQMTDENGVRTQKVLVD